MILLVALAFIAITTLVTFVQMLYLESLRLRKRDLPSLEYFRDHLEQALGLDEERGALAFSLLKHLTLVIGGGFFVLAAAAGNPPFWRLALEGLGFGFLSLLIAGYAVPQVLYRRTTGEWLVPFIPLLRFLALLVRPLGALLEFLESLFELGQDAPEQEKEPTPEEELESLITAGEEEGILEKGDRELIQNVVEFGDKLVREVMTPRRDVVAIDAGKTLEELRQLVISTQFSRLLVYDGNLDKVVGFIHVRDMFEKTEEERQRLSVSSILRPARPVPEWMRAADLFNEMRAEQRHIAPVIDEYGNLTGLATLEDLVEEVLGEIRDEHEPGHDFEKEPSGAIIVSGQYDLDNLFKEFGYRPEAEVEATTVGGLVTEWMGEVPAAGATVEQDGLAIEVLAADETRVEKVRIRRSEKRNEPESKTQA